MDQDDAGYSGSSSSDSSVSVELLAQAAVKPRRSSTAASSRESAVVETNTMRLNDPVVSDYDYSYTDSDRDE